MTSPPSSPNPASTTEIADLLAWARRLTRAGSTTDAAERAAYLAAKADLLALIADAHAHDPCHAEQARHIAAQARAVATQAAALLPPGKDIP